MLNIKAKVVKGKLEFSTISKTLLKAFIDENENANLDILLSYNNDTSITPAQMKKIYIMLKELSKSLGYNIEDIKSLVKNRCNLIENGELKSLKELTKEEASLVIEEIIKIGDFAGSNLR